MEEEVVEDENKIIKQPIYKVVNMEVSAINLDAEIEINDEDSLIISPTDITVVDNASLKVVYEGSVPAGDTSAFISTAGLTPDTEYTIYAKATFEIDGIDYTKSFVNKIFRTEALGVTFDKSYATKDSISVKVNKKGYSEVTSVVVSIYDETGVKLDYKGVDFIENNTVEVTFDRLNKNTKYKVVMSDVLCDGIVVEEGYFEEKVMLTLKDAPSVGSLQFEINKRTSKFELSINDVDDPDYGIVGYRYEIFDVRQNMNTDTPLVIVETNKLEKISVNVDEVKLLRGSTYTYRVAVIFEDNDKTVEYIKELGGTMQMDGVAFPSVRFDADLITWEQINGTIIVEDPNNTIVGDTYKVVYKNAVDVYTTNTIISSSSEETVPISVNNLRSNETYTFQVYASVNLKDGNDTIEQAYIGSVIVKTGTPEPLTASYEAQMNYSSAFSVDVQLSDYNGKSASLEASTISEMTLTLYQGSTAGGAVEVYRKVVDSNIDDYISSIKTGFYDGKTTIDPAFFNSVNNDFTEKTYTLVISDVHDYTTYKNEIPVYNNTFTFGVNNFLPDLPGANTNPVNVTKIANKNAAVFGLDYDANLEPNTIVGYSVISNFMNDSQNAIKMVYHVWAYNQLTGEYEIIKDYSVDYDEFGNVDSIVVPVGYGTANNVFDSDMIRRGNEYYFSYEVHLDIDGDGDEDTVYPTAVDSSAILKSASQFPEKQAPIYQIYPSVSTNSSAAYKYKVKDVDNCLESNNLYAFLGNDTTSTSSVSIIPNQSEFKLVNFIGLTSDSFYSIKANERKVKKRNSAYTTLSTQYLSPLTSSLDLTYEVEVNSNTLIVRITFAYNYDPYLIFPEDISNFKITQYTNNDITGFTEFEYDLVTKTKVNLADKRDEITGNDYFIKVYEEGEEKYSFNYVELESTEFIEDTIKDLKLAENKDYLIELGILVRGRYYVLDNFELSTKHEVLGISSLDDWVFIQPYGHYILLNDLNFQDFTDQRIGSGYRYFHGEIDFQGYSLHLYSQKTNGSNNTAFYRFNRLESDAVLKNLVLDVHINNTSSTNSYIQGLVYNNYGTIENVMVNVHDTMNHSLSQYLYGLLVYNNGLTGKINNFVLNVDGDVHMYSNSALMVYKNYGNISNGYIYGGSVMPDLPYSSNRSNGILTNYNGPKSVIENVYSNVELKFSRSDYYDTLGIMAYETYGTLRNAYVVGDMKPKYPSYGPFIKNDASTSRYENLYYISDNIYSSTFQTKSATISLHDAAFQRDILGDAFNIEEMIELGYFPQLKFSSNKMPAQAYLNLPTVNTDDYADIIYMEVVESKNSEALVSVTVNNPLGEEITEIVITNLKSEILSQTYQGGKTILNLRVYDPSVYVSKYEVLSVTSTDPNGYQSTRRYSSNEKFLVVDMYKEIKTVNDFANINKGLNQNYKLMNDLDFTGYTNFYINSFTGKFEGNNYTIRNINLTQSGKYGLFSAMNGILQNVTFENVVKSGSSSTHSLIGSSNRYGRITNVHIKGMTIVVDSTNTSSSMYIGALVGSASQSRISYSSVSDIVIRTTSVTSGMYIGGMVGYGYGMFLSNSFGQNVNITVENAVSTNGVGGLVGYEGWSGIGYIEHCYVTGSVTTNTQYVGGLIGYSKGYVYDSFSSVDVVSEMSYVGGITGYSYDSSYIQRTIYLGNLYSASTETNMRRIMGNYTASDTNYVMDSNLINGMKSTEYNGASVLSYEDYLLEDTYKSIFDGDFYDYSTIKDGFLPKLLDMESEDVLPNQLDVRLFENEFNVNRLMMDKHADDVTVTLYLDNPLGYEIKGLEVDDATVKITRNATENGVTVIEFLMTPTMFFDCYRMSKLTYVNELDEEIDLVRFLRLDVIFYKNLSSYDDWQNISTTRYENYILTNDIDFTGKTMIKTDVKFNRLETPGENLHFALKNINLEYTSGNTAHVLINRINRTLYNVKFENITINDTSSGSYATSVIQYNYADTKNLVIDSLNIDAPYRYYVGLIGTNYSSSIKNVSIENVNLSGRYYLGSLVAYQSNSSSKVDNVTAKNVDINVVNSGNYFGGVFGYYSGSSSYNTNFSVSDIKIYGNGSYVGAVMGTGYFNYSEASNIDISGISYVGGLFGTGSSSYSEVSDVKVNGTSYVGGIVGSGGCSYCEVTDGEVTGGYNVGGIAGYNNTRITGSVVNNSKISGSSYYIGGLIGYSYYGAYESTVHNVEVYGTAASTYGVGGFAGILSTDTIYRSGVIDTIVSNSGIKTGGFIGYTSNGANLYSSFIDNVSVTGISNTGGLVGELASSGSIYANRVINSNIISSEDYAGGIVGYYTGSNSIYEISIEDSRIQANNYAGGFFGGFSKEPSSTAIKKLYYGGVTTTASGHNYGFGSGDTYNYSILKMPRIYLYENSLVNDKTAKSQATNTSVVDGDLFEDIVYTTGYISSGVAYEDPERSYLYSDMVRLEAGKTYELHLDYKVSPDVYTIYVYNSDKGYVNTFSNAESYFGVSYSTTYDKIIRFTAYKDCFIRVYVTNKSRLNSLKLFEVTLPNGVRKDILLSAEQLREELTWSNYIGGYTSPGNNASKLFYSNSYWDFTSINKNNPSSVSITDLTSNKYVASGYVSSLNHNGVVLSGYTSGKDSYLTIPDYKLPSNTEFTFSSKISLGAGTSYYNNYLFSTRSTQNNYGFAVYFYNNQIYIYMNGSSYSTSYYIPYNTPVDISVTYGNKTLIVYVDGVEVYRRSSITLNSYSTYNTYIGYDRANTSSSYRFIGRVFNLKIYDRTLDALEVENNFLASSGIIDPTGLDLHFDFTQTYTEYDAYYPLIKPTTLLKQEMYPMPNTGEVLVSNPLMFNYGSSLSNNYHIYSSGIDTINIEFDYISDDLSFTYKVNDKEYTTDVESKVYALQYDYVSDIEFVIKNAYGKKTINLTSEELSKKILHLNGSYYNIDNGILYKNGNEFINNVSHIYSNLALLNNGNVYNLNNNEIYSIKSSEGILANSIPLKTYVLNNRIIKTYYNYTMIDNDVLDGQMFIKDGYVYMFNNHSSLNDNIVYNTYNTEEYQIVLSNDGTLVSNKAGIKLPNTFANSNIKEIAFDNNSNEPIIMVRYNSSNVLVFNYVTGEELFKYGEDMSFSLFDYLTSSLSYSSYLLTNSSDEYIESKEFIKALDSSEKNNVSDIIDQYASTSNNASNKLKTEYISVYNKSKDKFDIYNINDIITDKKDIIVTDIGDGEIVVKDDVVSDSKSEFNSNPLSDSVKNNFVLYDYFYNNKTNRSVKNNRKIVYTIIMVLIVGNLFILSYIYSKKEEKYE